MSKSVLELFILGNLHFINLVRVLENPSGFHLNAFFVGLLQNSDKIKSELRIVYE